MEHGCNGLTLVLTFVAKEDLGGHPLQRGAEIVGKIDREEVEGVGVGVG